MVPLYRLQGHIFLSQLLYSEEIRQITPFLQSVQSTCSPTPTIHYTGTFFGSEGNSLIISGVEHLSISFWIFRPFSVDHPFTSISIFSWVVRLFLTIRKSGHILDPNCVSGTGPADISTQSAAVFSLGWNVLQCLPDLILISGNFPFMIYGYFCFM